MLPDPPLIKFILWGHTFCICPGHPTILSTALCLGVCVWVSGWGCVLVSVCTCILCVCMQYLPFPSENLAASILWTITSALNVSSCEVMYTSAPNYGTTLCQTWGNTSCMPAHKCVLSSVHGTTLATPISLGHRPSHNYLPHHPAI